MNKGSIALLVLVLCLPIWAYLAYKCYKVFNSPDGERYLKRRMQGSFVPLGGDELAEDEARKK